MLHTRKDQCSSCGPEKEVGEKEDTTACLHRPGRVRIQQKLLLPWSSVTVSRSTRSTLFLLYSVTLQPWGLSRASQRLENVAAFETVPCFSRGTPAASREGIFNLITTLRVATVQFQQLSFNNYPLKLPDNNQARFIFLLIISRNVC